jgi:hypothetical protein
MHSHLLRFCFLNLIGVTGLVYAQRGNLADREVVKIKVAVEAIGGGKMKAKGDDGKPYMIGIPTDGDGIRFEGTALPAFLQNGQWVRFEGSFDQKGQAANPITSIEVFTLYKPKHTSAKDMQNMTPGAYPTGNNNAGLFTDASAKGQGKPQAKGPTSYRIVGQIRGVSKSGISVWTPQTMVSAEVIPDAKVMVTSQGPTSLKLVRPGDSVAVEGFYLPPNDSLISAERLRFSSAKPLGTPPEKPAVKGKE